jgi:hypothetical protein
LPVTSKTVTAGTGETMAILRCEQHFHDTRPTVSLKHLNRQEAG